MTLTPPRLPHVDLRSKRILIFVVAYNAEATIEKVLSRIPSGLHFDNVEVLIIDDSSKDDTFVESLQCQQKNSDLKITVLRTPSNQGYGGNQKLGYRYAIDNNFDIVALVHGDGQYAPEKLPELLAPLLRDEAEAVFGSRMLDKGAARRGGMPFYKWIGNKILTGIQNTILGTHLSEFHSGYRLYSTKGLTQVPFEKNPNDFSFDTDIIIQFVLKKLRIVEKPIPTFYGDEICYVNGLKYAFQIVKSTIKARLCGMHLFYDRKFDVDPNTPLHGDKLAFTSSQTFAVNACVPGRYVLQLGIGHLNVAEELKKKMCRVTAVDFAANERLARSTTSALALAPMPSLPAQVNYDQILLMDIVEHLQDPEGFMDDLRRKIGRCRSEVIVTASNVAFFITRAMLALGQFNYSRKGILGFGHRRLFTFNSLRALVEQAGYEVCEIRGVPAPFPLAMGDNRWSRTLLRLNRVLLRLSKHLFAYQICMRLKPRPNVGHLLKQTIASSATLRAQMLGHVA